MHVIKFDKKKIHVEEIKVKIKIRYKSKYSQLLH